MTLQTLSADSKVEDPAPEITTLPHTLEEEIRIQQATAMLRQQPGLIMGNVVVSFAVSASFWGTVPALFHVLWIGAIWLLMVPVTIRYFRYRHRPPPKSVSKGHIRNITIWSAVLGSTIGFGIVYLFPEGGPSGEIAVYLMAIALWGGALGAVWMVPSACLAFSIPIVAATSLSLVIYEGMGGPSTVVILVVTLFAMALFLRINYRNFRESVKARAERDSQSEEIRRRKAAEERLAESLEDLRAMQDQLIVQEKMASLGALTAGIAHEIKNPLNFINNYAELSVELMEEMRDIVRTKIDMFSAEEVGELAEMSPTLKANLDKIVEHGHRADRIVKSMLQHSRGAPGQWETVEINELVEEALNLAYHGARAQDQSFNVTIQRDFDPEAGSIRVMAQEINRVLLNVLNNAFYAVRDRAQRGEDGYEPTVSVSTHRSLPYSRFYIRVRDNGPGIPERIRSQLFQPFFTTKPAGSGTGLGLSLVYDIIVQQHQGEITVETEEGEYTEFIVSLPLVVRNTMPGQSGEH